MSPSLKTLVEDVRRVWNPPAGRPWSLADVAIVKLLKAIEAMPVDPQPRKAEAVQPACESTYHSHCTRCGWCEKAGEQCICYAR